MKKRLSLLLRIAVSAALLWFVLSRVPLWDKATLADGTVLAGTAEPLPGGGVRFTARDGAERILAPADLAGGPEKGIAAGILPLLPRIRWIHVPVPFLLFGGLFVVNAWRWRTLLRALGYRIPFRSAFELTLISQFFSLFLPSTVGGDVFKAVFVARGHPDKTKPILSVFVDRLLGVGGLVVLACLALAAKADDPRFALAAKVILATAAGGVLAAVFAMSRRVRRFLQWDRIAARFPFLDEIDKALVAYRGETGTLAACLASSVGIHVALAGAHWMYGRALGFGSGTLVDFLVIVPIVNTIKSIPVSISGIGLGEFAYQQFFGIVGIPGNLAVTMSLLVLATYVAWGLLGGVFLMMARHQVKLEISST